VDRRFVTEPQTGARRGRCRRRPRNDPLAREPWFATASVIALILNADIEHWTTDERFDFVIAIGFWTIS
jgi:hypothetical protein